MKRAYSVVNVLNAKFNTMALDGQWKDAIGEPELTGTWFIYGPPKNGKTTFAMQLTRYLSQFKRVAYNSIEEGLSLSIKKAMSRTNMLDARGAVVLVKLGFDELTLYLKQHKSPNIIIIDSIQFMEMKFSEYKSLKVTFPHKLFIYISHVEGRLPEGQTARKIWRDSNVTFRIEGFKAFPLSRYGGGEPITVSNELASGYWN